MANPNGGPGRPLGSLGGGVATPYPLLKMNHRHDALLEWLIANPHRNLKECAKDLGYCPQTIYLVVNSDLFQAMYAERCKERGAIASHLFDSRIRGVASLALEKTEERLRSTKLNPITLETESDVSDRFLGDATKTALMSLGYLNGNRETAPSQHLHIHVNEEDLAEARERSRTGASDSVRVAEGTRPSLPAVLEAPSGGEE